VTEKASFQLLNIEAAVSLGRFGITSVHLSITGEISNISAEDFESITREAEQNFLISKVLNIPVSSEFLLLSKMDFVVKSHHILVNYFA